MGIIILDDSRHLRALFGRPVITVTCMMLNRSETNLELFKVPANERKEIVLMFKVELVCLIIHRINGRLFSCFLHKFLATFL